MPFPEIGGLTPKQSRVSGNIARAASLTGIDFDYLLAQAGVESSFDPSAKASTSSASGLFQFTEQTWLGMVDRHGAKHGMGWAANAVSAGSDGRYRVTDPGIRAQILNLRFDPEASSVMAAEFASENRAHLRSKIGREPESVDLYLAHFLGAGGASKFLTNWSANPGAAAAPLFPQAAGANRSIFYGPGGAPRSLDAIRSLFDGKLAAAGASSSGGYAASGGFGADPLSLAGVDPMMGGFGDYAMPTPAPRYLDQASPRTPQPEAHDTYRPLQMQEIIPMPRRLSVDFARSTYERFSGRSLDIG